MAFTVLLHDTPFLPPEPYCKMLYLTLTALWLWAYLVPAVAAIPTTTTIAPVQTPAIANEHTLGLPDKEVPHPMREQLLQRRQVSSTESAIVTPSAQVYANATETVPVDEQVVCQAFGVDFREGGSYFVDVGHGGREPFKIGTRFEG